MTPISVSKKYTNETWTKNGGTLSALLSLAFARGYCMPFTKENGEASAEFLRSIKPTLSPKDPNFPAWWEKHKSEWEDKKKGGQEPADD